MITTRAFSPAYRRRMVGLILFGAVVLAVLAIKSFNDGWFEPQTPLELNDQPALVFFTLGRGCECQMLVIRNAEAQLSAWSLAEETRYLFYAWISAVVLTWPASMALLAPRRWFCWMHWTGFLEAGCRFER